MRINQILINVLNNAIKYTDKGAVQLAVSCERDETDTAFIFFTVKDTGIGIKKESIPYLFTAFKRLDEKKNEYNKQKNSIHHRWPIRLFTKDL